MFSSINAFVRTMVLAGLLGVSGWWTVQLRSKFIASDEALDQSKAAVSSLEIRLEDRARDIRRLGLSLEANSEEIRTLEEDLVDRDAVIRERDFEIEELALALQLLKVDHRLAKMEVVSQTTESEPGQPVRTVLRFTEMGSDGEPLDAGTPDHRRGQDGLRRDPHGQVPGQLRGARRRAARNLHLPLQPHLR